MIRFNPIHLLGIPAILLLCIPLGILAIVTTYLAFSALLFRVSIVYVELGAAIIRSWIFRGPSTKSFQHPPPQPPTPDCHSPAHRQRRSSAISNVSFEHPARQRHGPSKSESFTALVSTSSDRDFEGIGGWRPVSNNEEEEALWMSMNSRLQLPALVGERPGSRHRRSYTGGKDSPEVLRMSPAVSRARTPLAGPGDGVQVGYFGFQPHGQGSGYANASNSKIASADKLKDRERRKNSGSTSSTSSAKSSRTSLRRLHSHAC
ncbi:hypothetical protein K402DRAFT_387844 [Aulographum hederae CBS 113979]|uniref:Uncharacterized protein n=1 Tax=Aulographum hederae CBS 113979 TaxID=1176131 RepID=A0A6G1HG22_9PEZI|nr:hypothetical protein K402DRAFT_387844 [Aulographum hederae CBS 113979]